MLALLLGFNLAFAHGGGTDDDGCHTNSSTGDYHCHNGTSDSSSGSSSGNSSSSSTSTFLGTGREAGVRTEVLVMSAYAIIWTVMIARPLLKSRNMRATKGKWLL